MWASFKQDPEKWNFLLLQKFHVSFPLKTVQKIGSQKWAQKFSLKKLSIETLFDEFKSRTFTNEEIEICKNNNSISNLRQFRSLMKILSLVGLSRKFILTTPRQMENCQLIPWKNQGIAVEKDKFEYLNVAKLVLFLPFWTNKVLMQGLISKIFLLDSPAHVFS